MNGRFGVGFWGIVAAQLLLLLAIVGAKEYTLHVGTTVVLQTVHVDPRSLLQGDYAVLEYEISTLPNHLSVLPPGTTVYVMLAKRDDVWVASSYRTSKPAQEELFIRGTADDRGILDLDIGTYFVPEGTGHIIEGARDVKVEAAVDSVGKAVIKRVLVDGKQFDPN